jgi:pimeloyl-ACP methyl ester carboxylesterase
MNRSVLYFHGFASSPRSQKVEALRELLEPDIVLDVPDLNVPSFERLDFDAMASLGVQRGRINPPNAVVGSSLGALVALEVVRRGIDAPLVLIAPGLGVGKRWASRIAPGDPVSVFNYERNAQAPIHRAFFDGMNRVEPEAETPVVPVTVIMGRKDETVPFDLVRSVWEEWEKSGQLQPGSQFVELPEGDHSLVAYVDVIAREIRASVTGY